MHKNRPVTRLLLHAIPGSRPGLRVFWMVLLGAAFVCASALAAPPKGGQAAAPAANAAAAPSEYVGSETCATCHEEVSKGFASNPHTKMTLMHGNTTGVSCENCHGPGKAHVDGGGDVTKIFNPAKSSAKAVDAKCESCHGGAHPNFAKSAHGESGLSCISCHSVHHSPDKEQLLRAAQPTLCYQCHSDQKAQFNMPFHHKVNEGLMVCSDCHDPHGTFQKKMLKTTAEQNQICTKCHTETRGPFVFEHAPVKAEGCNSCHTPHGSPNPRLMNVAYVNTLCLQCHSDINNVNQKGVRGGVAPTGPVHNQSLQYVACTNCHTQIHGSNTSAIFFK